MYKIGIDLGGTKTESILLDGNLNVLERKRVQTPQNNYQEIIATISSLVLEMSANISNFSLGVCIPGAITKQTGLIKNSNTQCLIGKPLKQDLENKLGKTIPIEDIIKMSQEKGIDEDEVEEVIQRMKRSGDLFEPRRGFISKI